MMRQVSLLVMLVFAVFALLQVNDPDPAYWIAIYGGMVVLTGMSGYWQKRWPGLMGLAIGLALGVRHFPWDGADWLRDERAYETFGLVLCVLWSLVLSWRQPSFRRKRE